METEEKLNNTLDEVLLDTINKVTELGNEAVLFGKEQIPDVIQQLLIWEGVSSLIIGTIGIVIVYLYFSVAVRGFNEAYKDAMQNDDELFNIIGFGSLVTVIILPVSLYMISKLFTTIKILVAPKLYLLEYAADLLK